MRREIGARAVRCLVEKFSQRWRELPWFPPFGRKVPVQCGVLLESVPALERVALVSALRELGARAG